MWPSGGHITHCSVVRSSPVLPALYQNNGLKSISFSRDLWAALTHFWQKTHPKFQIFTNIWPLKSVWSVQSLVRNFGYIRNCFFVRSFYERPNHCAVVAWMFPKSISENVGYEIKKWCLRIFFNPKCVPTWLHVSTQLTKCTIAQCSDAYV